MRGVERRYMANLPLDELAEVGLYVVQGGQAVVDGRVYEVAGRMTVTDGLIDHPPNDGSKRSVSAYWLRPLTDEAPPSDETTSTTTTEAR